MEKLTEPAVPEALERLAAQPEVLSVEQTAVFLGLSLASTYAAVRAGEIPARQVGRRWLISRPALVAWLRGETSAEVG